MNLKTLLLTFVCIILFAVTSASAFQVTAARKTNPNSRKFTTQSRSYSEPYGSTFGSTFNTQRSTGVRRAANLQPVLGRQPGFGTQPGFGVPMQSVIINGQVVLLPVTGAALLQQAQQQQALRQQVPRVTTPQTAAVQPVDNQATPDATSANSKPSPLRVKSKYFDAED